MATVRFLSPSRPNLFLPGVPARFVDGVCDIDVSQVRALTRMRYLGVPYGVIEVGQSTAAVGGAGSGILLPADFTGALAAALDDPDMRSLFARWFEARVDRTDASVGQSVVLEADSTLGFGAPPGGAGGGTGSAFPSATATTIGGVRLPGQAVGDLGGPADDPFVVGFADLVEQVSVQGTTLGGKASSTDSRFTGYTDVTTITGTSLTLAASHVGDLLTLTDAAAITVTAPTPTSLGIANGQIVHLVQGGAGAVTVTAGAGAGIDNRYGSFVSSGQFATLELVATSGTRWLLRGEVA